MSVVTVDVIDAVQRTLEREGLLQSIRAQLRSSVMKVLTSDLAQNHMHPHVKYAQTENGRFVLCLVRDLLVHLDLKQSLAVFDAESTVENFYDNSYSQVCSQLHLQPRKDVPLLEQLVDDRIHQKPILPTEESSSRKLSPPPLQPSLIRNTVNDALSQNQYHGEDSPQKSPQKSPQSSPPQQRKLADSKSTFNESFEEDEKDVEDSFEHSPQPKLSNFSKSNYGIQDGLEDLMASMSPQKDDTAHLDNFNSHDAKGYPITPGNILDIKSSPPSSSPKQKKPSADDSMLDEIEEIVDSFAEEADEDEYDFNHRTSPPKSSTQKQSPEKPTLGQQQVSLGAASKTSSSFFAQDSSEEDGDDDLPAYGYVGKPPAEMKKSSSLPELPPVKGLSGRLPFNARDFLDDSKLDGKDQDDQHDSFAESPQTESKKSVANSILKSTEMERKDSNADDSFVEEEDIVEEDLDMQSGPEYDSGDQDDGDFSQLDHFMTGEKDDQTTDKTKENNKSNVIQVQSSLRSQDRDEERPSIGRAQINRTQQASERSSKGWDVGSGDTRYDDDEEEVDQLSSSPVGRIVLPGLGSNRRNDNRLDDMESSQLSIDDHQIEDSRQDEDSNIMHTSYRSNQEEEEEENNHGVNLGQNDSNDELLIDHDAEEGKMHPEDHEDSTYEEDYDNDFVDPDQSVLDPVVSSAFTKVSATVGVFSKSNQKNLDDDDDDYADEYGEEGFEDDDNEKSREVNNLNRAPAVSNAGNNKRYAGVNDDDEDSVEEEIASEIEEEEDGDGMSVGGGDSESDEDRGWTGKPKAKLSEEPSTSSLFKQRSGVLPTLNNLSGPSSGNNRPTFSNFGGDDDDEDDDDGLGAFSVSNRSSAASQPNLRYGANSYSNNNQRSYGNSRSFGGESEDNSVASENLSIGGDNSGEESFSMND